jgi:hypothetical protein
MLSVRYRTKGFEIRLRCEQPESLVVTRKKNRGAGVKKWRSIAAPWKTCLAGYVSTCLLVTCGKSISPS